MSPSSKEGLALRGWVDLTSGRETLMKKSVKYFDEALSGSVKIHSLTVPRRTLIIHIPGNIKSLAIIE